MYIPYKVKQSKKDDLSIKITNYILIERPHLFCRFVNYDDSVQIMDRK